MGQDLIKSRAERRRAVKAVIFDMDGLMIDSERIYWDVGRRMARSFGKEVSDKTLGNMMGRKPIESMEVYAADLGISVSPAELRDRRDEEVLKALQSGVTPMPGLMTALDELLRGNYRLAIATSAIRRFVDVVLAQLGIASRFELLQTSDDVVDGKPNPEIYLRAISKLGVTADVCAVLEDSSNGALAGKRAGAYTIAVPSEYTHWQDFNFVDYLAKNLDDAVAHLCGK